VDVGESWVGGWEGDVTKGCAGLDEPVSLGRCREVLGIEAEVGGQGDISGG